MRQVQVRDLGFLFSHFHMNKFMLIYLINYQSQHDSRTFYS